MPADVVPVAVMLEQLIATNVLAKVSNDVADLTGTPATSFDVFVRDKLA
jgi:hypothetical protein